MSVFIVPFSVSRLWFFLDSPLPMITPDSGLYYLLATQIASGEWPLFAVRQPGYPLLIWLLGSDGLTPLLAAQNLLTLLSALCVVFGAHRLKPRLSIGAAVAMAGFACSGISFEMDSSLMSDGVYASCVVFSLALLFCAWGTHRTVFYALSSSAIAAAILIRPDGLFLLVIYLSIAIFMIRNRFGAARCFSFCLPAPVILLLLCGYNYSTLGIFSISPWGNANLAAATHSFWQTDERFAPSVNSQIEFAQSKIRPSDREILKTSWDMKQLNAVFERNYEWRLGPADTKKNYAGGDALREVSLVAIEKQPILYVKFVLSNLWRFYFHNLGGDRDPRESMRIRAGRIFVHKVFLIPAVRDEYEDSLPPAGSGIRLRQNSSGVLVLMTPTRMQRAYFWLNDVRQLIFNRPIWNVGLSLIFTASLVVLMRSRLTHDGAFLLFVLTSTTIGASLVVCLVEIALSRYSYVTSFASYLSVMLMPLLFEPTVHPRRPPG